MVVKGRASHAGVDFQAGASAVLELARQIDAIAGFTQLAARHHGESGRDLGRHALQRGGGGGTARSISACCACGTRRRWRRNFGRCKPFDKRCTIEVTGGLNRPPMERSAGIVALFRMAQKLGREIGVELEESLTGGGSDGNFTAALGMPTLDGLGAVGEGAHAANESLLVDRMADRTALLAKLLAAL